MPLRPLTMGEIWRGVTTAVRGNPAATIGLALVVTVVVLLPLTALGIGLSAPLQDVLDGTSVRSAAGGGGEYGSLVPVLALYVTSLLLPLFMAVVVGQGVQGRRIGLGETWRAGRGRIWAAIGVVLLVAAAAILATTLVVVVIAITWTASDGGAVPILVSVVAGVGLVVLFVLASVRWAFATTVVVLEGLGPVKALRRSWTLVRKQGFWRIFGIRLLTAIIANIASSVVTLPLTFGGAALATRVDPSGLWVLAVVQAVSVLVQSVLFTPFTSGVDALLYIDQRFRYEGLDVALVQQLQGEGSAAR